MATFRVKINKDVLAWVRNSSGYDFEELESRYKYYRSWEKGEKQPTYNQLKDLANFFKRPVPLFFFKSPPENTIQQVDFRRLPESYRENISPKSLIQIRAAANKAKHFKLISSSLGVENKILDLYADDSEDPEELAKKLRNQFHISQGFVKSIPSANAALRFWRDFIESLGVLTFGISVRVEEIRGASLIINDQPIILFSTKDSTRGRIFTLFHELAHILIKRDTDHFWEENIESKNNLNIETFCNRFSSEFILPEDDVTQNCSGPISYEWIKRFAKGNHVSAFVALFRLKTLDIIDQDTTERYKDRLQREITAYLKKNKAKQKESKGGPSPYMLQAYNNSPLFMKRVYRALDINQISTIEAARILNTRNVSKLRLNAGV